MRRAEPGKTARPAGWAICLAALAWAAPASGQSSAVRDRMDQLTRELAQEKAKTAELERRVAQLVAELKLAQAKVQRLQGDLAEARRQAGGQGRAGPAGQDSPAPETGQVTVKFVDVPGAKIDGLGVISRQRRRIAGPVPGGEAIRVVPTMPRDALGPVAILTGDSPAVVNFSCRRADGGAATVARVELKPDGVFWQWQRTLPRGLNGAMKRLDEVVKTSFIEVHSRDRLLARYQVTPPEVTLALAGKGGSAGLPYGGSDMRLVAEPAPSGWRASADGGRLTFSADKAVFTVALDPARRALDARWQLGDERVKEIDREIRGWESDNKQLATLKAGASSARVKMLAEQMATNASRIEKLKRERSALLRRLSVAGRPAVDCSGCRARIVSARGVVLFRVRMKN